MSFRFTFFRYYPLAIFITCLCYACGDNQKVDREAVKLEMKSREIKRMTESDIQLEGERLGKQLVSLKGEELNQFIQQYQIQLDTLLWDAVGLDSTQQAILGVYQFAQEDGLTMPTGIQGSNDKSLFFCQPFGDEDVKGVIVATIPRKQLIIHYEP